MSREPQWHDGTRQNGVHHARNVAANALRGTFGRWLARESGHRDMRLLPAALGAWASALAMRAMLDEDRIAGTQVFAATMCTGAGIVLLVALIAVTGWVRRTHPGGAQPGMRAAACALVCIAAALTSALATTLDIARAASDPAMRMTRDGPALAYVDVRAQSPPLRSASRSAACTVRAGTRAIMKDAVMVPSSVDVRVLLAEPLCARIVHGGGYRMRGTLARASWDIHVLQLAVDDEDAAAAVTVRRAPWWRRAVHTMQRRFFAVTEGLSDQGRVLVPGLTLGVLGQDAPTDGEPVNEVYATRLEEECRRAGIIHLMAVSGGHYALVGSFATMLCALVLAPRWVVAAARAMGVIMLTVVLVPSESITRAVIMQLLAVGYVLLGRREQTMPLLLWTSIIGVVTDPQRAADFGFALSCAAVLGIALVSGPVAEHLRSWLPRRLADALATTVGAQVFTLPVQLLLQPEIPVWSVPANLLVAPWMDAATVCGLASYAVSWCMPWLGFALAWCASLGTKSIELAAGTFGADASGSTVAWGGGVARLAAAELIVLLIAILLHTMADVARTRHPSARGFASGAAPIARMRLWCADTRTMLTSMRWHMRPPNGEDGSQRSHRRRTGRAWGKGP